MASKRIVLFGGSGFVGRCLVSRLAHAGYDLVVISRTLEPRPGSVVEVRKCDTDDPNQIGDAVQGAHAVVSLAGILNERGSSGAGFLRVHAELPERIARACLDAGIRRLIQMSALKASPQGPSLYLKSKAEGERRVAALADDGLDVTFFRPSVIFGRGDSFVNRFAKLLRLTPFVFPLACPDSRFAPVWVEDVAGCFCAAVDDPATFGNTYELCGPDVYTLREIVRLIALHCGIERRILGLADWQSRAQAMVMNYVPGKPFSIDNYLSLQVDSTCDCRFPEVFDIQPARLSDRIGEILG